MDKMCNRVCEIIAGYESDGILQSHFGKNSNFQAEMVLV